MGRRVEVGEPEGVVEHAGVDRLGCRGRTARAAGRCVVRRRPGWARGPASRSRNLRSPRAQRLERRRSPARARRGERAVQDVAGHPAGARPCPRSAAAGSARGRGYRRTASLGWGHVLEPSGPGPRARRGGRAVPPRRDRHDPERAEGRARTSRPRSRRPRARRRVGPRLPDLDRTDLPFVTIDPPARSTSTRRSTSSATAAATSCTTRSPTSRPSSQPGDPIDLAAHARGETLYGADSKVPLHPTGAVRGRGLAAARPGAARPAVDDPRRRHRRGHRRAGRAGPGAVDGQARLRRRPAGRSTTAQPARPCSCSRRSASSGSEREAARGGISLPLPEQEVDIDGDQWSLEFRSLIPAESWNAQISLLTGFARGVADGLRPGRAPPYPAAAGPARRPAAAPHRPGAPHRVAGRAALPRLRPQPRLRQARRGRDDHRLHAAAARQRVRRLRRRDARRPDARALASEYAHVTAPLRRLGDRYAGEICVALCAGTDVPDWVLAKLHDLPEEMKDAGRRAHAVRVGGARPGRGRRAPGPGGGAVRGRRSSTSTTRTRRGAPSPCRIRPSRHGSPRATPYRWARR